MGNIRRYFRHTSVAFTLIETMIVVAIFAVVAAVGLGMISSHAKRSKANSEMEMFCSVLHGMPAIAKSGGIGLIDENGKNLSNMSYGGYTSKDKLEGSVPVGFGKHGYSVCRVYKDGELVQESLLGSEARVTVTESKGIQEMMGYVRGDLKTKLVKGTWLTLTLRDRASQKQEAKTPYLAVVFRPDGTPLYAGRIRMQSETRIIEIYIDKNGDIHEKNAEGTTTGAL
ncbi:MAG: prepilin-type N-terminal cleavage/methylation domain-containing protein [bacterium]|nr:prepilin-type N-terminal cleavage/methylation domain-containing protein [bacterium]